jgi:hypothetical protein
MYFNVVEADYIERYRIKLVFQNGKSGIIDLEKYISDGEIFEPFKSIEIFKNFTLEFGTLTWNDGSIDIAPETLYQKATGEPVILENYTHRVG